MPPGAAALGNDYLMSPCAIHRALLLPALDSAAFALVSCQCNVHTARATHRHFESKFTRYHESRKRCGDLLEYHVLPDVPYSAQLLSTFSARAAALGPAWCALDRPTSRRVPHRCAHSFSNGPIMGEVAARTRRRCPVGYCVCYIRSVCASVGFCCSSFPYGTIP